MRARRSVAVLVAAGLLALPASPALGRPGAPTHGVVAATATTGSAGSENSAARDGDGGTAPATFALLVGGLVGALLLIGLAVLPATATPRFARERVDRVDTVIAGALALLSVTLAYVVSVL